MTDETAARLRYLARRLAQSALVLLLVVVINFFVLHLAPGDIADVLAGEAQAGDAAFLERLKREFGLDRPVHERLAIYLWKLVQLDLGHSAAFGERVLSLIAGRLPATLLLMATSIALAFILGAALGTVAALNVGRPADAIVSVFALLCYATPSFLVGLMMIVVFTVKLGILPLDGMVSAGVEHSTLGYALDVALHLVMPMTALALFYVAIYTRLMRAAMLEVLGLDYVRTAQAKGLRPWRVIVRHAMRNALMPMVTMCGVQASSMLGGAVLIETVFGWPGIGRLAFDAVFRRDVQLVMGILFLSSIVVALVNLVVDLVYVRLDPRIALR